MTIAPPRTYVRGPLTPDDPRHGTPRGYNQGCRDDCCRAAAALRKNLDRLTPKPLRDATGTHRRVRALARLGYSSTWISRELGAHRSYTARMMRHERIQVATAERYAALYDRLCMTWCDHPDANDIAARAAAAGWAPPLAWDESTIDDPAAEPEGVRDSDTVDINNGPRAGGHLLNLPKDDATVARILDGDWTRPCSRADKVAVVMHWIANNVGSLTQLERLTGWRTARYAPEARQALAEGGEAA